MMLKYFNLLSAGGIILVVIGIEIFVRGILGV